MPLNKSVQSGDYSGGSGVNSGQSKASHKVREIDDGNIQIDSFQQFKKRSQDNVTGTDRPNRLSDSMRKYSIKEELVEEELIAGKADVKMPQS